jgi:hypothetical protein
MLHLAIFLGGAACSAVRLWLTARDVLGTTSYPALGCYDLGSVGLAGYISSKGWAELHNMNSSKLFIKLFNINNCLARTSSKKTGEQEDDIVELGEYKLALRALRTVYSFAMPWNFSILALEGFFSTEQLLLLRLAVRGEEGPRVD